MDVLSSGEVLEAIEDGTLEICSRDEEIEFLDEFRIALHVEHLYEVSGVIDLRTPENVSAVRRNLERICLEPGSLYLATTRERFVLGHSYAATIHTRSRYARLGLEFLCSSNFVVPGFGSTAMAPLVLEVSAKLATKNLSPSDVYVFLLVHRLGTSLEGPNTKDYLGRFPMSIKY